MRRRTRRNPCPSLILTAGPAIAKTLLKLWIQESDPGKMTVNDALRRRDDHNTQLTSNLILVSALEQSSIQRMAL
jgi:hypothetical protein